MFTDYTQRRDEVLAEYARFAEAVDKFKALIIKEARLPDPSPQLETALSDAKRKADNIRADRFRLMVAGESKSGKSTFINAYLGVELLPMDVKQCTSSIVEIKYGEAFNLVATCAGGEKISRSGEQEIRDFLKKNAALGDEYRDIPVPTINYDLLVRYGKESKVDGKGSVGIPEQHISNFLKASEIKAANIYGIEEYDEKIRTYIKEKKDAWESIIVKIELFAPFKDEVLKGIEIIDSPGVCARGGVSEITEKYIESADAIIFLKPISGQALESSQFSEFLKNATVERNKDTLFLVFTRTAVETPANLGRLQAEAVKQFSQLDKKNILFVDSKAELCANYFESVRDVESRISELYECGTLEDFVESVWNREGKSKQRLIAGLKKKSNFTTIDEALSRFGRQAHYIALRALLDVIAKVYVRIIGDLGNHGARFREKADDPTELAKKIDEIKKDLDCIKSKMHKGVDEIVDRYNGEDGVIKKRAEEEAKDFKERTEKVSPGVEGAFRELEECARQKIEAFNSLQNSIQKDFVIECDKKLTELSRSVEIQYTSFRPDFSEETFKEIKETTENDAKETKYFQEGITFQSTYSRSVYSRDKHLTLIRDNILARITEIKNYLVGNLSVSTSQISSQYTSRLRENMAAKKKEMDEIYEQKLDADRIQDIIGSIDNLKGAFEGWNQTAKKLKGGLDRYVQ